MDRRPAPVELVWAAGLRQHPDPSAPRDVRVFLDQMRLSSSDRKELRFWHSDPHEGPGADLFDNLLHKSKFMAVFLRNLPFLSLAGHERVLELGGGHCWASALIKRRYPECYVVASDISPDALATAADYEKLLGVQLDEKWACSVEQMAFADGQFDLAFTFAAFHHFIIGDRYASVLGEILRVLRPGGRLVMLYEPSAPATIYKLARARVQRKRQGAALDEDILELRRLRDACRRLGATIRVQRNPDFLDRPGRLETLYYAGLSYVAPLQTLLPCTVNVMIEKAGERSCAPRAPGCDARPLEQGG
jgi:SAM-dependent methyltransferase